MKIKLQAVKDLEKKFVENSPSQLRIYLSTSSGFFATTQASCSLKGIKDEDVSMGG